ncbi:GtrA family protein [Bifidobacterium hapali]|uniref:GtrA family protein n=2 Tax=Bifidobacterium hapali TaxID=1630172 RepID=A0A261G0C4_9BIFI|nr:GtrA family protein [Bifidobacterium hapali]
MRDEPQLRLAQSIQSVVSSVTCSMADVKKLIAQLMKFGIVGVIAFVIDWGILNLLVGAFHMHNVIAATISFIISLIFNYLASMKFVFKHRPDMARWMEVLIFVVAAVIGLFMNDLIIWISTYGMNRDAFVSQHAEYLLRTNIGKLIATAVVMVWNFAIRKWLLDDTHTNAMNRLKPADSRLTPEELDAKWESSFSRRLGMWSLEHTPKGWQK